MNNVANTTNSNQPPQDPPPPSAPTAAKESEHESSSPDKADDAAADVGEEDVVMMEKDSASAAADDSMDEDSGNPATVFYIKLKQPKSNLLHKMSVPELCRTFSAVAWCGKLNSIACASETCARIPSSTANPPFWIPIHIVIPERPTECTVFNVIADSPRDSVQFIEWSPTSCPRALLIANFHGRITIWTQPSQGPANLVKEASCWQLEYEWRQDIAVVTKWLSGASPYRRLSARSSGSTKSTFEEKFLSQQPHAPAGWPNFLCVCSVFSSGSIQLHWSQWPPNQSSAPSKWFCTSKGLLGAGPSGIMAADAIVTDSGALHVAGVPIVNPSTVVVWEVTPGPGNGFQAIPKASVNNEVPPSLNPPSWDGFAPLAAYLFSWQEYLLLEAKQGGKKTEQDYSDMIILHCSPVSNFSAYVSPEAAAQSAATTTWGSGVTAIAFDPTRGGSVISVVIVEGQYMSPYDPDEGPSVNGWRVQRWESSVENVVIHQIFGNPSSNFGGQTPKQTVWVSKVNKCIAAPSEFKCPGGVAIPPIRDGKITPETGVEKRVSFDPFDLPSDIRTLARIVYSAHGGEIAVSFLQGGVHVFSGANFTPVDSYQINVGSAIAAPAFSSTSCCSASVWHDNSKDCTILKIIRVLPPVSSSQAKANSAIWERAIAERFWWSLLVGVDWWDAVGCTQSAAEDGIVSLNSVIAVLDADFHSLPSTQHRQQYGPSLDRIKCRLLEGTTAQEVRAMVLDMQARLLLDMLGKGIESALINPSALFQEPWQASGETLSNIDPEAMAVDPALVLSIQAYVDAVLDLASHFITRLRRYASFCRTLASHAATAGTGGSRNLVTSPTQSTSAPATAQGSQGGTSSSTGSTQMQAWVQGAIAKISSTNDTVPSSAPNTISGPSTTFMPISINTGTFPGTPAVRLIGDCHFLHRLCQLLLFCFFFRRTQLPRFIGAAQRNTDSSVQRPQIGMLGKSEETNSIAAKPASIAIRSEETHVSRVGQVGNGVKAPEEGPTSRSRLGSGNAGQGYTFEEVKVLFLILMDLCRRTSGLAHPLPLSQVGSSNIQVRLHYIDGNYTVLPEVVEASLGPHMQNMPRPRGADAAGLLLRELELHPPAEEWHKRNMFGGPWSDRDDVSHSDEGPKFSSSMNLVDPSSSENDDAYSGTHTLWPRKRRMSERDAAFGLNTSVGLGAYYGIMGSRRDVVTAVWKTGLEGTWYKCIRCLRQTSAFASPGSGSSSNQNEKETWWISRWSYGCPMCGGTWVRVV
ncbi:sensitive to freezing 6 [Perilla frutescens var. frutescens]|nr:sensitive to freezing 6 [Perilla frutescens var. frutescens]